jgi:2-polyprenyl-3-methyl-5-hydroxy-6-metoxy-1,4-benzoquinol methylase
MTYDDDADAFVERLFGSILGTVEITSIAIGDALGFYRALAAEGPATSSELAARTGTAERYAREWLEQQAATGFVDVDDVEADHDTRRYTLPPAHAEVLTDGDSLRFLAGVPRMFIASMARMPELLDAYRSGDGVGWARFGEWMLTGQGDTNRPLFLNVLAKEWLPSIDPVHRALTAGGRVADIGCGTGWSSIAMALGYPDAIVHGFDLDEPSIDLARRNADDTGVAERVTFHGIDAADADPGEGYDLALAFECIHDMPYPAKVLDAMRRLVGDRGTALVVDERVAERFTAPADDVDRLMYGFSMLVCLPDGTAHPGSVGTGTVMRPDTLRGYAREGGWTDIEILPIEHDTFRVYRLVA